MRRLLSVTPVMAWLAASAFVGSPSHAVAATRYEFCETPGGSGDATCTIPMDYGSFIAIHAIGCGGRGAAGVVNSRGGGSGGGGEYQKLTKDPGNLAPGATVHYRVGDRSGSTRYSTYFKNAAGTIVLEAKCGGDANGATGGAAGTGGIPNENGHHFDGGPGTNQGGTKGGGPGGGGSGGPSGPGKPGGYYGSYQSTGAGGGGSNNGAAGSDAANSSTGGNGGAGPGGSGTGTQGTSTSYPSAATNGGGGGGAGSCSSGCSGTGTAFTGAAGGVDALWDVSHGPSGGGGGGYASGSAGAGGAGGTYGGGGGGAPASSSTAGGASNGGRGLIVIEYADSAPSPTPPTAKGRLLLLGAGS